MVLPYSRIINPNDESDISNYNTNQTYAHHVWSSSENDHPGDRPSTLLPKQSKKNQKNNKKTNANKNEEDGNLNYSLRYFNHVDMLFKKSNGSENNNNNNNNNQENNNNNNTTINQSDHSWLDKFLSKNFSMQNKEASNTSANDTIILDAKTLKEKIDGAKHEACMIIHFPFTLPSPNLASII